MTSKLLQQKFGLLPPSFNIHPSKIFMIFMVQTLEEQSGWWRWLVSTMQQRTFPYGQVTQRKDCHHSIPFDPTESWEHVQQLMH